MTGSHLSAYHSLHKKQGGTAVDSVPDSCVGRKPGYQFQAPCDAGSFLIFRSFLVSESRSEKTPFKNLLILSEVNDERQVKTDHG